MPDRVSAQTDHGSRPEATSYDLVVIGAGIAGLNALHAATDYLPRTARVLLIDQKPMAGGMWNTAYDFVRLHQPHPSFTVGNLKWKWDKPPAYLAARDEVRDHLAHALRRLAKAVDLETSFGHTATACDEIETEEGPRAQVRFHPMADPARERTVTATRAIFASGADYHPPDPLALSSDAVISIIPQDLRATLAANPKATLHVIGGGKTAMDVVLAALAADPARKVVLVSGPGTSFIDRASNFPTGLNRWISGTPMSRMGRDLGVLFDGDNEEQVMARFRRVYSTDPNGPHAVFLFGIQSKEEQARIAAGLSQTHRDYLVDVIDTPVGAVMTLRGGATEAVAPGSIFVNCTGSIFRGGATEAWRPCLSPQDTVLRITPRDGYHLLTSASGFFLTHLLYRGRLRGTGHYTLDHDALFALDRNAWVGATLTQLYMHRILSMQTLPLKLLDRCALDFDRWYPVPRRMLALLQLKATAASDLARCRTTLDRVADRFGIHCAPLN